MQLKSYLTAFSISAGFQMLGNALFFPSTHLLFLSVTDITATTAVTKPSSLKKAKFRTFYRVLLKKTTSLRKDLLFKFLKNFFGVCSIVI